MTYLPTDILQLSNAYTFPFGLSAEVLRIWVLVQLNLSDSMYNFQGNYSLVIFPSSFNARNLRISMFLYICSTEGGIRNHISEPPIGLAQCIIQGISYPLYTYTTSVGVLCSQ